ncbi:MAG: AAA family ATPase [Fuerstiella sp.]|nr:AAA family ATPase [Fuerstiella sp.]MCP4855243.1 AAA family ATPase [Fuerstiella sp.]
MLKSLELFGFKSFADKTVFEFHEGITGVVGPNGSGKSNVVDSIKWLLGDQSAKSLRGKEMTDVIFNGSSSRGGAQFAEATLVFDNSSRFLPMEHDEVSVGRRLWKTGDSEYLINRQTARLKDVRDLLVGTGAGAASYCIIEQGRVDQILQSNAANRRLIFEEAAGISRFKQRRNEAERRLERVEQNLLRLTDIVDEVESQVNAVRNQAKRTMRLREVSTELEKLWVGMVADDFRRQSMVRENLTKTKEEASTHLTEVRERQQRAERELADADQALAVVDDELREVERSRAELRSRIASLETTLRHHAGRESELQSEGLRLTRQQSLMDGRVAEAEKEEEHLNNVLTLEQKRFTERTAEQEGGAKRLHELHASLATAQAGIQESRNQLIEQSQQNSEFATQLGGLRHEQQSLQQRRNELLEAHEVLTAEIADLEQQLKRQNELQETAQTALHAAEEFGDRLLTERDNLLNEQSLSRDSLAELREQRSAAVARKTVLEDLEDRQEGFGLGAREILKRAEEGASEPWSLIRGSVADLLDVDMENAALLEVALSGRAQLLVIEKLSPLIDYLNSGRCQITDRVGFVSLEDSGPVVAPEKGLTDDQGTEDRPNAGDEATGTPSNPTWSGDLALGMFGDNWLDSDFGPSVSDEFVPELNVTWVDENGEIPIAKSVFSSADMRIVSLAGKPGVIGRADSLARSPRHIPTLASQLLADTWVVQSLNDALRLQKEVGDNYRFITLQGELVEKDSTLFTGSVRSESAVVSRKSELRRLKNELHRIEHLVSERDIRLQKLVTFIELADDELQTGRDNVNRCAAELRTHQQSEAELQQAVNAGRANDRKLTDQLGSLSAAIAALDEQIVEGGTAQEAAERQFQKLQEQIQTAERDLAEDHRQVDILKKGRTEADLELTRSEERLLGIRDALERLEDDLQQRRLQQQEAARRLKVGTERLDELNLSQLNVNAETSELRVYDDQLTTRIMERSDARRLLRQHRQDATAAEQQARQTCRQHETMFHEAEMKINAINHQLETSAERIQDEFQISVEEAVESGRSAIAVWLTEQAYTADGSQRRRSTNSDDGEQDAAKSHDVDSSDAAETDSEDNAFDEPVEITVDDASVQQILRDDERYDTLRVAVDTRVGQLRRQLKKIGNVGTESLDNLNELETRFGRLDSQLKDLEAARDTLREMVRQINVESRRMFEESFECIRGHFRELFRRLFGGGEADVILEDPEDVLECAIDVVARPPGKELRSISLLSGGEKTMTAVALLLSIFKSRPSPFCILDEVDAALDDANIGRFVGVLKDFQQETQFIMITHRKPTMAVTDVLYGVTMEESGISKRLVVRFEEIDEKGNFVPSRSSQNRAA